MAIAKSELNEILVQKFPNAIIKITNLANDEDHYSLDIKDQSFNGISLIKQHKMVNDALAEVLRSKLHAITIKTSAKF
jgi:stress-induced morphogen